MSKPSNLEILEQKIGLAVEKISKLGSENRELRGRNDALQSRIADLERSQGELEKSSVDSQRLLSESQASGAELEDVRKRVDSILEKFERLDL